MGKCAELVSVTIPVSQNHHFFPFLADQSAAASYVMVTAKSYFPRLTITQSVTCVDRKSMRFASAHSGVPVDTARP